MKKSHLLGAVCACIITLVASTLANASIVYEVNRTIGDGTVIGFIETDGTMGVLTTANITNWELTLSAPNLGGGSPDVIDYATQAQTVIFGTATTATSTQLLFDFSTAEYGTLLLQGSSPIPAYENYWQLRTPVPFPLSDASEFMGFGISVIEAQSVIHTGTIVFAEVSAIPIPAAAWLFGSGLFGLAFYGKKRSDNLMVPGRRSLLSRFTPQPMTNC